MVCERGILKAETFIKGIGGDRVRIIEKLNGRLVDFMPEETIFLCENRMLGRRILAEAAKESLLIGVRAETPLSLAMEVCSAQLGQENGWKYIDKDEAVEIMYDVLQKHTKAVFFDSAKAKSLSSAEKLYDAFQEMEMFDISALVESGKQAELQELRELYRKEKEEKKLLDKADLFHFAIETVSNTKAAQKKSHYLTLGAFHFTPLETRFLSVYTNDSYEVISVGIPESAEKTKGLMEKELHQVDAFADLKDRSRFFACRGIVTEVRHICKDILKEKRAFEDCAVVYLSAEYGELLKETAGRFDIPVTISGGVSMTGSLLYYMLQKVAALPLDGFLAEEISSLLETGAIRMKKDGWSLAKRLRKERIGWGDRERYRLAVKFEDGKEKPAQEVLDEWDQFFDLLFAVTQPEDSSLDVQRKNLMDFLSAFANRTIPGEAEAYVKAMDIVQHVVKLHDDETLLQNVIKRMERASFQGDNAEAGKVFCMPLSQAFCTGRKHIYVVGNSRYSIHGGKESPILLDAERKAHYPALKTVTDREMEMQYRYLQMVYQHAESTFTFTYPSFDSSKMLEILPSPLFRKLQEAADAKVETITYLAEQKRSVADHISAETVLKVKEDRNIDVSDVDKAELADAMSLKEQLSKFVFSPSSMETALKCPFQFYMQKVLKLNIQDPVRRREDRWLDRNVIGSFCHEVLENFYAQEPGNVDLTTDKAKEKLDKLFDESFEKVKEKNPEVRQDLMDKDKNWARNMIERAIMWTQQENRTVLATEKRFGTTDDTVETEGLKLKVKGREFRLQGSIDRVDRLPGVNGAEGDIVVLDYKTGDIKKMQREKEQHLQDYLYPLALKALENDKYDVKDAGYLMLEQDVQYLPGNDQKEKTEKMIYGLLEWMDDESRAKEAAPGFQLSQDGKKLELASEEDRENIFKSCRNYCKLVDICPMNRKEEDSDDA